MTDYSAYFSIQQTILTQSIGIFPLSLSSVILHLTHHNLYITGCVTDHLNGVTMGQSHQNIAVYLQQFVSHLKDVVTANRSLYGQGVKTQWWEEGGGLPVRHSMCMQHEQSRLYKQRKTDSEFQKFMYM